MLTASKTCLFLGGRLLSFFNTILRKSLTTLSLVPLTISSSPYKSHQIFSKIRLDIYGKKTSSSADGIAKKRSHRGLLGFAINIQSLPQRFFPCFSKKQYTSCLWLFLGSQPEGSRYGIYLLQGNANCLKKLFIFRREILFIF